jgi:soluble lytic murein transglycosylase-like protein
VPHREHYAPKHLGPKQRSAASEPTRKALPARLRSTLVVSGAAVAVTGLAVSAGIVTESSPIGDPAAAALAAHQASSVDSYRASGSPAVDDRSRVLSRSEARSPIDEQKERALNQQSGGQVTKRVDRTPDLSSADPRTIAKALLSRYGYGQDQFSCLDAIYSQESGWNPHAANPSGAYGVPQAKPGSKMASVGSDWQDSVATQVKWGLGYIKERYSTPCGAWDHSEATGWY